MPADSADRCDCGAVRDRSISWCSQCHAPHPPPQEPPDARFVPFGESMPYRPPLAPRTPELGPPGGRWRSGEITFGPVGRIVATVLVTMPLLWFLKNALPFGFVGLVIYGAVLWPWALRDIWGRTRGPRAGRDGNGGTGQDPARRDG